jgi:hypothetical protein
MIKDIKRTIPQHFRQAATEYEKGYTNNARVLAEMALKAIESVKELEAAIAVSGMGEE